MNVCMYFQVHQPFRLRKYSVFDIGANHNYFDEKKNREVMQKVARKCYLPTNGVLLDMIRQHGDRFKIAFSITGTALEQFEEYAPEVLESFKELARTGNVEFLAETYYHSLSFLFSKEEFKEQVALHSAMIQKYFGQTPKVFRNTELIFTNELAKHIEEMGYSAVLAEGADHVLGWRSPNYVYNNTYAENVKMLLKNYKLSDDIAFRFGNKGWAEYPLTAEKFAHWVNETQGDSVNLFMDYETFGEHQWEDTGIFEFMRHFPSELFKNSDSSFIWPSELANVPAKAALDIHHPVSWADVERDLSAWLGNPIQDNAIQELYSMEREIKESGNPAVIDSWRKLTTSDHYYYMCTKWFNDGDVHKYFNPYDSPYEAFIAFMNVLQDLRAQIPGITVPLQEKR
ncbi:MAG: glycoside hydrolase family 57 protein [Candidatus Woesearchaeota archaeon]